MQTPTFPSPPKPRVGIAGLVDRFIGPGATRAELALQLGPSLAAAAAVPFVAELSGASWSLTQTVVASVLALDLVGGIITNATSAAKRWYHRAGQGRRAHATFVSIHLAHIALVTAVFVGGDLGWALTAAVGLILAAGAVLSVPTYLQRPVAYASYAATLVLTLYGLRGPVGLEWFLPLFYLKLLVSHLPTEYPFEATQVRS